MRRYLVPGEYLGVVMMADAHGRIARECDKAGKSGACRSLGACQKPPLVVRLGRSISIRDLYYAFAALVIAAARHGKLRHMLS